MTMTKGDGVEQNGMGRNITPVLGEIID